MGWANLVLCLVNGMWYCFLSKKPHNVALDNSDNACLLPAVALLSARSCLKLFACPGFVVFNEFYPLKWVSWLNDVWKKKKDPILITGSPSPYCEFQLFSSGCLSSSPSWKVVERLKFHWSGKTALWNTLRYYSQLWWPQGCLSSTLTLQVGELLGCLVSEDKSLTRNWSSGLWGP